MEGPKTIYLNPVKARIGFYSAHETPVPSNIKYIRADIADALVEAAEDLIDSLDKIIHPAFVGYTKIEAARAALAALKAMEES